MEPSNPQSPSREWNKGKNKPQDDVIYNYVGGSFYASSDCSLSVHDICVLRGFGVFDYLRTYNHGTPFRLSDHVRRLRYSADQIGLDLVLQDEEIVDIVQKTIAQNAEHRTSEGHAHEWGIRLVATGGPSPGGFLPESGQSKLVVLMDPLSVVEPIDAPLHSEGIKIATSRVPNSFPTIKSTNYLGAIMATQAAKRQGASDALYMDVNETVTECTRANIFFVNKNGVIVTSNRNILEGITRKVVLDILGASSQYTVETRVVTLAEALDAEEAFVTSTTKELLPVVAIDDVPIGTGTPGPVTRDIHRLFVAYAQDSTAGVESGEI